MDDHVASKTATSGRTDILAAENGSKQYFYRESASVAEIFFTTLVSDPVSYKVGYPSSKKQTSINMTSDKRLIDLYSRVDQPDRDVELLVLGLSRTGTMSMYKALPKLGYKPYHCNATTIEHPQHLHMWLEALKLKHGPGTRLKHLSTSSSTPYSPAEFAKYYRSHGYTAITDMPSVLFAPELMKAFPNARIVLSHHPRGIEGWLNSMKISILPLTSWSVWDWFLVPYDTFFCRQYIPMLRRILEIWSLETTWAGPADFTRSGPSLRAYHESHLEEVRTLAKQQGRNVLEFNPTMGWEPLCKFLGKDVPQEPYPHINEAGSLVRLHYYVVWIRTAAILRDQWLKIGGIAATLGFAAWWVRS